MQITLNIYKTDLTYPIKKFQAKMITETIIEEYFKKYTRAFEYWKELKFEFDPVTPNKLNGNITITHAGTNKLKNNNDVLVKE